FKEFASYVSVINNITNDKTHLCRCGYRTLMTLAFNKFIKTKKQSRKIENFVNFILAKLMSGKKLKRLRAQHITLPIFLVDIIIIQIYFFSKLIINYDILDSIIRKIDLFFVFLFYCLGQGVAFEGLSDLKAA
ncbi:hypothetical protein ACJX0J_022202, partial [Zea mays]